MGPWRIGEDGPVERVDPDSLGGAALRAATASRHKLTGVRAAEPGAPVAARRARRVDPGTVRRGWVAAPDYAGARARLRHGRVRRRRHRAGRRRSRPGSLIGQRIDRVERLLDHGLRDKVGLVLGFDTGTLGLANLADELVPAPWPGGSWSAVGVSLH
jgi:hypothetical protein